MFLITFNADVFVLLMFATSMQVTMEVFAISPPRGPRSLTPFCVIDAKLMGTANVNQFLANSVPATQGSTVECVAICLM